MRTFLLSLFMCSAFALASSGAAAACVVPGRWLEPGQGEAEPAPLLERMSRKSVVLLGETHNEAAHHVWQLDTLRALHALRPDMVIGLEMLPRAAQPVLDAWVRGELGEDALFERSRWRQVWGVSSDLYAGIFRFAREHRVPLRALNVERKVVREVTRVGLAGVPLAGREGVGDPARPLAGYTAWLQQIWGEHMPAGKASADGAFARFLDGQLLWDRAMAEALAGAARANPAALVVGLMGSGHVIHGYGVEHQLRDLGVTEVGSLLPWDADGDCGDLVAGVADAVFGIAPGERRRAVVPQ
ncbi:MAG: ChaN family lipoprotein [Gammaproteobacteria bacterium]|nr:ChaN family lipoprotein [Gammaproteobacteria bacterium]MBU0773198.1 ChaN family lipoprotein [Gammaproteobacteria bacterium]MBU0857366.1 ChaN family lipoprotein [Gammaproteobacteria bacterium]MBU1848933.1 ChaN family lipoprotein [Gammaproteobacteria bacterium]